MNLEPLGRDALLVVALGMLGLLLVRAAVPRLTGRARSQERREAAVARILDGARASAMITTDLAGTITMFGVGAERLLGRDAASVVGRLNLTDLHVDDEIVDVAHSLGVEPGFAAFAALATADTDSRLWTQVRADGARLFVRLALTELRDDDGTPVGYLAVGIDETASVESGLEVSHARDRQLSYMADHDALTGLMNRERFIAEIQDHLSRTTTPKGALLLLDLDRFKEVNDLLGHVTGDQLIVSVSALLRNGLGHGDLVARLGGDEFAILLPDAEAMSAEVVAQGILDRVRAHVRTLDGAHRRITASIGVVLVNERHASASDLLAEADMTMYDAKEAGRDRYAVVDFTRQSQPTTRSRIEWTDRLQRAIADDDLVLLLQPILDMTTGRVTGAEALLRLVDGDTLVTPNHFLEVAEKSDLIVQVDQWVIGRSLELLSRIQQTWPTFQLEVNLSGRSIGAPQVERALRNGIAKHKVDPTGLVLEITETAAVADIQAARAFAQRLCALGCKFALDDFGAGFGSFYYLKHLLFDYVKIDGEFVAHCHTNATDTTILRSIVGIAHGLGKRAIAEHVSEPEILEAVRAEGVDFAQGYHVGRPVAVEEFMTQLVS